MSNLFESPSYLLQEHKFVIFKTKLRNESPLILLTAVISFSISSDLGLLPFVSISKKKNFPLIFNLTWQVIRLRGGVGGQLPRNVK